MIVKALNRTKKEKCYNIERLSRQGKNVSVWHLPIFLWHESRVAAYIPATSIMLRISPRSRFDYITIFSSGSTRPNAIIYVERTLGRMVRKSQVRNQFNYRNFTREL